MIRSGYHDHFDAAMAAGSTARTPLARYFEALAYGFEEMGRALKVAFEPVARLAEALGREQA